MRTDRAPVLLGCLLLVACGSRTFLTGGAPEDGFQGGAGSGSVGKGGSGGSAGSVARGGSGGTGGSVAKGGSDGTGGSLAVGGAGGSFGPAGAGGGVPMAGTGGTGGTGGSGVSGTGGSGSVSPVGGGTANGKCGQCLESAEAQKECGTEIAACAADPACAGVLACSDACTGKPNTGACIGACQQQWASGGAAYYALAGCWLCGGACSAKCSAPAAFCDQFDGPPPVTGGGSKCAICQHEVLGTEVCASPVAACAGDPVCTQIRTCLDACDGSTTCSQGCVQGQAPNDAYLDFAGCLLCGSCADVCKPGAALCDEHGPLSWTGEATQTLRRS